MTWQPEGDEDAPTEYALILPFIDQSPEFCHGFEAGQQYARMMHGGAHRFRQAVHVENSAQLMAAAKVAGWRVRFEPLDDTFSIMHAERLPR